MEQLNNTANNSPENNQELPKNNSNISFFLKKLIIVIIGIIFLLGIGHFLYKLYNQKHIISGTVFYDKNQNGGKDSDDKGLGGIKILLKTSNGDVINGATLEDGSFTFGELRAFKNLKLLRYSIEIPDLKYFSDGKSASFILLSSKSFNLGLNCPCVTGTAYHDYNGNLLKDLGEEGIPFVTLNLQTFQKTTLSTTTDSVGNYLFAGLPKNKNGEGNNYVISIINPESQGLDYQPTGILSQAFRVPPDFKLDFPLGIPPNKNKLTVVVYLDENRNQKKDPDENNFSKAILSSLSGGSGFTATADPDGTYTFTEYPGSQFTVSLSLPAGFESTVTNEDGDFVNKLVNLEQAAYVLEFGMAQKKLPSQPLDLTKKFEVSGAIFIDSNENGKKDPGEKGYECEGFCITNLDGSKGALLSLVKWQDIAEGQHGGLATDRNGFYTTKQWLKNNIEEPTEGNYHISLTNIDFLKYKPTTPLDRVFTLRSNKVIDFGIVPVKKPQE